jgi:hypothetical protein
VAPVGYPSGVTDQPDAILTTAFLIVRGDSLLYEGYFNGYDHDSIQTSMSVAKSVLSARPAIFAHHPAAPAHHALGAVL